MNLLQPITALVALAIAVPLLLVLYFLKLRRRTETISSTMFWRQAIRDLEANTPFQRLRVSPLLLLQILLLLILIAALGRPIWGSRDAAAQRVLILIDASASMSAAAPTTDGDNREERGNEMTRLDLAKERAAELVNRLADQGEASQAMVIAIGRTARTVHSMSGNLGAVRAAIERIEATDEIGHLQPALALAEAFLTSAGEQDEAGREADESTVKSRVVLLSDGRFEDRDQLEFSRPEVFEFLRVPEPDEPGSLPVDSDSDSEVAEDGSTEAVFNVGIVSLAARRDFEDPGTVRVLCGLLNTSASPQSPIVRLELDDEIIDVRSVEIPAMTRLEDGAPMPGEASIIFTLQHAGGGVLRATHSLDDALTSDNEVHLALRAPKRQAVLVVHPEDEAAADPFLADVIDLLEFAEVDSWSAARFNQLNELEAGDRAEQLARFDLVVFDRVAPGFVPVVSTISFGAAPPIPDLERFNVEEAQPYRRVLSWDRGHPVMADVNLDALAVADRGRLRLPEDAPVLALGAGGPILAAVESRRVRHVIASFEVSKSNWPIYPSFPIFLRNAVEYLTLRSEGDAGVSYRAGESIAVHRRMDVTRIEVSGFESGETIGRPVDAMSETVALPLLSRAGWYRVEGAIAEDLNVAVNVLSPTESNLLPLDSVRLQSAGGAITARPEPLPRDIWPWFVASAIVLLILEWLYYILRARR